ncbi:nucleoside-diphosphate-sugar epimerase [Actinokineospora baliensis]|uniref:NAD-dependent epimerase/dehydratase family protein n=1 Tax=Actinokineospora baliensis TaxID=547056 RepID=UPI00195C5FA0|nr:NAD-dependent epimerase/dehydratase family protein [Actinokineospora baliensis]MBM7774477.1 nucleoside-diphosphate-sugar epimerase [Actinokineospora baliensis]
MRLLVLGGTSFLSWRIARVAVGRGHEVVCAARGRSGSVPEGARLVVVDRDRPGAVDVLAGYGFDAVVDVATGALGWVLDALEVLGDRVRHWTFVSSVNAYADTATVGQGTDAPLCAPVLDRRHFELAELTVERYGGTKVASENAVRERVGQDRAFIVRPGVISGPGDQMHRFGYWASRFARGGPVVVPDVTDHPLQHVDVRDLAAWIVTAAERHRTGTFDAVGPVLDFTTVLRDAAALVGAPDLRLVPVAPSALLAAGITPWGGPRSLPFWLPTTMYGLVTHDPAPALAAGLPHRTLTDTLHSALADAPTHPLAAGLTAEDERVLLQ